MKNNKVLQCFLGTLISLLLLSGCSFFNIEETPEEVSYDSLSDANNSINYYDIYKNNSLNAPKLNSIGNQKILVLPIHINGSAAMKQNLPNDDLWLASLNDLFFGDANDTYWHSVKSYYQASSYNKLIIDGVVGPIYNAGKAYDKVPISTRDAAGANGVVNIAVQAIQNYKTITGDDCTQFDSDKDGYIDAVWLVYDLNNKSNYEYPTSGTLNSDTNPYWAYTTNAVGILGNTSSPTLNNFAWASYDFMFEHSLFTLDAHTYIHETGHLLGLDDYYDYNGKCFPMGNIDMMDWNVGDHNAFSKYALGWITPKVVNSSITVDLASLTETGQSLILKPQNYNNTAFSEYFMLMYVTPTGLNYEDYINGYYSYQTGLTSKKLTVYNKPGLLILHVTSYFGTESGNNFYPSTNPSKMDYSWVDNTSGSTENSKKINLISVIDADYSKFSTSIYDESFFPNNGILFQAGDSFNLKTGSVYRGLMGSGTNEMNDGTYFRYNININTTNSSKCNVSITTI